jgi:RNA polymerase sigma-70 factor (ECF subfamily)
MLTSGQFEALALPHLSSVYRLARQLAGPDRAEDLAQETFLKAWRYFHTFDQATNCRAWLCRILHNTWISHWRKTRLEFTVADMDDVAEPTYDPERERLGNTLSREVQRALDGLPEAYRFAVLLADVEELSYQEIADAMSCPIGTVMSRVSRGRKMLARLVREQQALTSTSALRLSNRGRS